MQPVMSHTPSTIVEYSYPIVDAAYFDGHRSPRRYSPLYPIYYHYQSPGSAQQNDDLQGGWRIANSGLPRHIQQPKHGLQDKTPAVHHRLIGPQNIAPLQRPTSPFRLSGSQSPDGRQQRQNIIPAVGPQLPVTRLHSPYLSHPAVPQQQMVSLGHLGSPRLRDPLQYHAEPTHHASSRFIGNGQMRPGIQSPGPPQDLRSPQRLAGPEYADGGKPIFPPQRSAVPLKPAVPKAPTIPQRLAVPADHTSSQGYSRPLRQKRHRGSPSSSAHAQPQPQPHRESNVGHKQEPAGQTSRSPPRVGLRKKEQGQPKRARHQRHPKASSVAKAKQLHLVPMAGPGVQAPAHSRPVPVHPSARQQNQGSKQTPMSLQDARVCSLPQRPSTVTMAPSEAQVTKSRPLGIQERYPSLSVAEASLVERPSQKARSKVSEARSKKEQDSDVSWANPSSLELMSPGSKTVRKTKHALQKFAEKWDREQKMSAIYFILEIVVCVAVIGLTLYWIIPRTAADYVDAEENTTPMPQVWKTSCATKRQIPATNRFQQEM